MVILENTFIPKTIVEWNELNAELKSIESSETFSSKLTRDITIPTWYLTGDRTTNIWHAKLRMRCSP